ncbi:MAG: hypothetical protein JSV26_01785 [bacterium]|nr:MAG: hypothetical protein JSV26_01785 [bacterium]
MNIARNISLLIILLYLSTLSIGVSFGRPETQPDFTVLEYLSGERVEFERVHLAPANLLVVTETTCYSCIKELRALELLKAKYRDSISVSAAFVDRHGLARIERYLEFYDFQLDNILIDSSSDIPKYLGVDYIPTIIIFDRRGNEFFRKKGFNDGDESLFSAKVDEILYSRTVRRTEEEEEAEPSDDTRKTTGCASTPG